MVLNAKIGIFSLFVAWKVVKPANLVLNWEFLVKFLAEKLGGLWVWNLEVNHRISKLYEEKANVVIFIGSLLRAIDPEHFSQMFSIFHTNWAEEESLVNVFNK